MVHLACSPATWRATAFERVLDDVADAGYTGVEINETVARLWEKQPGRLRSLLAERHLTIGAAPLTGWFFDREERREELARLRRLGEFLAEMESRGFVVFSTVPNPARRDVVAGAPPPLPLERDRVAYLADTLNQFSDVCTDFGLRGVFQNRVGSHVETPDEYLAVVERTEPDLVWLAPDVGDWLYAGGDPAHLLCDWRARIAYPRLKGFDQTVFDRLREERRGYGSFVAEDGFTPLGGGTYDMAGALQPLLKAEYDGWVVVEPEWSAASPKESARLSRDYLRERLHW